MPPRGKITLVLFFFATCAVAAWFRGGVRLDHDRLKPADLFEVVRLQLDACRVGDFPSAYRQASAAIREKCPLDRFADQIRNENARSEKAVRVEFGPWQRRGRRAVVEVFFVARDGSATPCLYSLVREGGHWKIEGTRWLPATETGQRMRGVRS